MLMPDPTEADMINERVASGGRIEHYETVRRHRDGSLLDASVSISPVRDGAGRVTGAAAIARDITARKRTEAALRRSELRYRTLISQLPDSAVYEYDADLRVVGAEGALLERLGQDAGRLIGRTLWELLPDARAEILAEHHRAALAGEPHSFEWDAIAGTILDVDLLPLRAAEGEITGALAFVRDVSQRRHEERELHFQAALLDRIEVAVVATDVDGRVTHWNRQAERWFERPRAQALGRPLAEVNETYGLPDVAGVLERLAAGGTWHGELSVTLRDGTERPILTASSVVRDSGGEIIGFVGVSTDLTATRRTAAELHRARSLFESAFENAPLGMALVRAAVPGRRSLMRVNRALAEMLDAEPADLIGRSFADLVHPDDLPRVALEVDRLFEDTDDRVETELVLRHGQRTLSAEASISVVRSADGAPQHAIALFEDVTAARALERRLHQAEKLDSIGRLAGGIAHDFNNLLAVILNFADLVLDELPPGDASARYVGEVKEAAERAAALTRQLLFFGRREVVQAGPLDINAVLEDLGRLLHRTIGEDIELLTQPAPGLWQVQADHSQIEQVLLNLALNARDAMREGGLLTIETTNIELDEGYVHRHVGVEPGRYVRLTVADDGCGMPPEVVERAFEPFFTTKPPGEGTGLGLATVYSVVTQVGGHVDIYSEPGRGTAVRVTLPATLEAVSDDDAARADSERGGGETVLVVEDEPSVRAIAAELLTRAGYTPLEAADGEQAMRLVGVHTPDLVITDVVMPGMSGGELAAALRERHPELPVLFMSGYTDDIVMRHGVEERRFAFLEKPFTRKTLLESVRHALDRADRGGAVL
jgi:PAS domain S-box-containing protein